MTGCDCLTWEEHLSVTHVRTCSPEQERTTPNTVTQYRLDLGPDLRKDVETWQGHRAA
jgi:hypothetical protein